MNLARRNTVYLCYGYVAAYAPVELIPSRAEVTILTPLKPLWRQAKGLEVKMTVIKVIDLLGKALHPSRLTSPYVLASRDELVDLLLDYIAPVIKVRRGRKRDSRANVHSLSFSGRTRNRANPRS